MMLNRFLPPLLALAVLGLAAPARAQTNDAQTPAEESVCDGVPSTAHGTCVAYCEASACETPNPNANKAACDKMLLNYMKKTGGSLPPCAKNVQFCKGPGSCRIAGQVCVNNICVTESGGGGGGGKTCNPYMDISGCSAGEWCDPASSTCVCLEQAICGHGGGGNGGQCAPAGQSCSAPSDCCSAFCSLECSELGGCKGVCK